MASNKWLRDFEAGVSKKNSNNLLTRKNANRFEISETQIPHSPPIQRANIIKPLNFGEFYEPIDKKYNSSIQAISGHRPRCKRQIASVNGKEKLTFAKRDDQVNNVPQENNLLTSKRYSSESESIKSVSDIPLPPPLSTREIVFNLGALGRVRSGAEIVSRIGESVGDDSDEKRGTMLITPVRSGQQRLAPFEPRRSSAPTTPIQVDTEEKEKKIKKPTFKSAANLIRAVGLISDRAIAQKTYAEQLSVPRLITDKVVTDGTDKTMWDLIELKGSRAPGPGDYNSEASLKKMEAPSGGRFNMSRPKSDIEWNIKRSSELPDPGSYVHGSPKTSGGRFNMSMPLSDIEVRILRAKESPGAGQYQVEGRPDSRGGGRFNVSKSKTDIEWKIYNAKQLPGPGEYQVKAPIQRGGRFNEARPQTDVEVQIRRASETPGPGEYKTADNKLSGGRFNVSNPKSDIEQQIFDAQFVPGPSDYMIKDNIVRRSGHTGKFPFVYKPNAEATPSLKKFANAVNTIKTMNRLKGSSGSLLDALKKMDNKAPSSDTEPKDSNPSDNVDNASTSQRDDKKRTSQPMDDLVMDEVEEEEEVKEGGATETATGT
mmetsp:Transcript_24841/g.32349  ORF Transcript_24841/g.32349 Transcript_24841/m.32349 type:complete len:599 (-) Transcript_24841:80-1876(-)